MSIKHKIKIKQQPEEDKDEIDPKYICYYSDLPSVLNYQEEDE